MVDGIPTKPAEIGARNGVFRRAPSERPRYSETPEYTCNGYRNTTGNDIHGRLALCPETEFPRDEVRMDHGSGQSETDFALAPMDSDIQPGTDCRFRQGSVFFWRTCRESGAGLLPFQTETGGCLCASGSPATGVDVFPHAAASRFSDTDPGQPRTETGLVESREGGIVFCQIGSCYTDQSIIR